LLQAANLTKRYGRLTALSDVSFSVREGEVLGLIGPNGSGKTTLFECLGGVLPLDAGTVLQNGRPTNPMISLTMRREQLRGGELLRFKKQVARDLQEREREAGSI